MASNSRVMGQLEQGGKNWRFWSCTRVYYNFPLYFGSPFPPPEKSDLAKATCDELWQTGS